MSFFTSFKKLVGIINLHEGIINEKQINLNLVSHFGLLSQSKKTAYDPFNRLLAIGSDHGIVKIYGRSGIEITIQSKIINSPLVSLCFIPEQERLMIVYNSIIQVWNLNSITKEFDITYENKSISTVVYSPLANVIYVGFKDGDIFTINISHEVWQKALYKIEFNKAWNHSEPSRIENCCVISILINPERDDYITIGYGLGIIEWDIKERRTLRAYKSDYQLLSMCWDVKFTRFYAFYNNGERVLWKHKKTIAEEINKLSDEEHPVDKMITTTYNSERLLMYYGGSKQHRNILRIEYYSKNSRNRRAIKVFNDNNEIIDVHLVYKSPLSHSDPTSIICISDKGEMKVFSLSNLSLQIMPIPIAHMYHQSSIISSKLVRIPQLFHQDIIKTSRLKYHPEEWPITGGEFMTESPKPTLLVTGNSDKNVYIWDVSLKSTMHLITLLNISIDEDDNITCIELCPVSREIFVGTRKGHLFHYVFSMDEEIHQLSETTENKSININELPQKDSLTKDNESSTESSRVEKINNENDTPSSKKIETEKSDEQKDDISNNTGEITDQDNNSNNPDTTEESKVSKENEGDNNNTSLNNESDQNNIPQRVHNKPHYPNSFYQKNKLELDCNITSITYESGLGYLAIGSDSGDIIVYKLDASSFNKFMHLRISSQISSISFCETVIKENNTLLLILCCINGDVFHFNMNTKEMHSVPSKNTMFIKSLVVHHKGRQLSLKKRIWNTQVKPEFTGRDTFKDEKYLVHCTVNEIAIYNIPSFEIVQKMKTPAPISWFGCMTVNLPTPENQKNEESCLYGIDHSFNLHLWTLMDLREILKMKNLNALKSGAFSISPVDMKSSCSLMDGTFVLFSERSESFYFSLASHIDQRPYHTLITSRNINTKNKSALRGVRQLLGSKKEVNFEKIFGEVEKTPTKVNESTPRKNPNEQNVIQGTSEVTKTLREVTERLDERGEKLNQLSEKTSEMAMNSASFAEKARKLAELQKKRSWF